MVMSQSPLPSLSSQPSSAASPLASHDQPVGGPLAFIWRALSGVPQERVAFVFIASISASLLLPFLGAVGLYDPWEGHYAEVAREMVARDDYVYPHWKDHYFFSKPVLLFWLSAVGFKLLDIFTGQITDRGPLPELTELAARLPIALIALLCLFCLYRTVNCFFGRRAAVLSSLVLVTTPFYVLVGRQHITDMPFVGLMSAGLLLMMEVLWGPEDECKRPVGKAFIAVFLAVTLPQYFQICRSTQLLNGFAEEWRYVVFALAAVTTGMVAWLLYRHARDARAHAFYLLCALACLAKGLPGILLPGLVFLVYFVTSWEWWRLRRIQVWTGSVVWLFVAAPWFLVLSVFTGKDDEGKTFTQRFWIHDHLNRATGGVHGDRGSFEYYIKQMGFGCFPWSGLFPFAWLALALPQQPTEAVDGTRTRVRSFVALWALVCFALFSISTTKLHHYILPMVIPLSICAGVWLAELWEKRLSPPLLVVLSMALGTTIVAQDLWRQPYNVVDLFTYHYVSYKPDYYMPNDFAYGLGFGIVGGISCAFILLGAALSNASAIRKLVGQKATGAAEGLRWLASEVVELALWVTEALAGLFVRLTPQHAGRTFVVGVCLAGLISGYYLTGVYFLRLAPHWSQRWLFNTYYSMRKPDEPIIAYLMNWRGESFYAKALDAQINDGNQLKNRVRQPGREFVLVETTRFKGLESTLGADFKGKINIVDRSNVKWYLVLIDE
jgi:4-amino-4-deoxy-L-arabinose transferase-like glycosyltransferase